MNPRSSKSRDKNNKQHFMYHHDIQFLRQLKSATRLFAGPYVRQSGSSQGIRIASNNWIRSRNDSKPAYYSATAVAGRRIDGDGRTAVIDMCLSFSVGVG